MLKCLKRGLLTVLYRGLLSMKMFIFLKWGVLAAIVVFVGCQILLCLLFRYTPGHNSLYDSAFQKLKASISRGAVKQTRPVEDTRLIVLTNLALEKLCRKRNLTLYNPGDGIGEYGVAVDLRKKNLPGPEQKEWEAGYNYAGYNVFISDRIALRRKLPDFKDPLCHNITYATDLPQASVIIPYHKEALSALMRTVLSTLDRSAPHLLKEVILVDDFSESVQLLEPLNEFLQVLPKVQVIRNTKREGLMRTRMKGVMAATAPVVVIKDAHTESFDGWLEPLLAAIAADRNTIALATVQHLSRNTFGMTKMSSGEVVKTFDFTLWQQTYQLSGQFFDNRSSTDPVPSPAMLGTEFAIDKDFFLRLGGYDPGMDIWGGEEMELSFKTWMCGGSMKIIPCSFVAHLFRETHHRSGLAYEKNKVRIAQVWMDEYKDYVYERHGSLWDNMDPGNITERVRLRKDLQCKSFDWYLRNVASMVYAGRDVINKGEIRNIGEPKMCLESAGEEKLKLGSCRGRYVQQYWMLTETGQIRKDTTCLKYDVHQQLAENKCVDGDTSQQWNYTEAKAIVHVETKLCLGVEHGEQKVLRMRECVAGDNHQQWDFIPRKGAPKAK